MATDIPVYLFTGFLDSGKTKFIQETLADRRFNNGESTLLLVCEEGEEEYDASEYPHNCIYQENIDDASQLNPENLEKLLKAHKCTRVVVEYNGMWLLNDLYNGMPSSWLVAQEFFFADANTILTYNANMRNLVGDKLASCELVVFNRFRPGTDKMPYHQLVRTFSRRTDIAYEAPNGEVEYDDIQDPLPFDVNAPVITVGDDAYALWYRDMSEDLEKYDGKTVCVKGLCAHKRGLGSSEIVFGRNVMTCCIQDMKFAGLVCRLDGQPKPTNKTWITLTAKISVRAHAIYGRKGPVLTAVKWEQTAAPEQEVATFY